MKKYKQILCVILAFVLCIPLLTACLGGEKPFKVGMAMVEITPTKDVYLEGYVTPGSNAALAKYPDDFTESIMARVLVIDNGEAPLVFINMEILINYTHLFSAEFKNNVANACDTTADKVFLSNTHNHQSNSSSFDTTTELKIMSAVREAKKNMVPAGVGISSVPSNFIVSRGTDLGVNYDMPVDNMLTVLRFDNIETGEPIGLVWNAAFHNTMLSNGYPNNYNKLSCEFGGYACRFIEGAMKAQNDKFVAMSVIGFTGNTGPNYNGKHNAATVDELKQAGNALGNEILNIYNAIDTPVNGNKVSSMMGTANLPRGTDPLKEKVYGTNLLVTTAGFGDVCYFGVNYEVFSVIGSRLKAEAPYAHMVYAGVSLGSNAYLPTKEAFDLQPYYETTSGATCFGPEAEAPFYETAIKTICNTAGVSLERVNSTAAPVQMDGNVAVYGFDFGGETTLDKMVISFAQKSRNDCASDYELKLYNASGKEVFSQSYNGYSINYVGTFVKDVKFVRAELRVSRKWQSGEFTADGINSLTPNVYGIRFNSNK